MNFTGIKAITFDAGGTLLEPWPSVGAVYARVAVEFGFSDVSAAKLDAQFAKAWKNKEGFDYSRAAWRNLVEECFAACIAAPVSGELFDALYERFGQPDVWRVYDDVRPTLRELHGRGYRLGVISNWDLRLESLLRRLELSRYLDAIILSVNVGATKPSARIFEQAVATLNTQPSEVLHVGDSIEEDVEGGTRAGLRAVLLDRSGQIDDDITISTLGAILTALK